MHLKNSIVTSKELHDMALYSALFDEHIHHYPKYSPFVDQCRVNVSYLLQFFTDPGIINSLTFRNL